MDSNVNTIHSTILGAIDNRYSKVEGKVTYDLTRGFAFGLQELAELAIETERKQRVDNLTGSELDTIIMERVGLSRKTSVKAVGSIRIVTGIGSILKGDLFATEGGVQFVALESKDVKAGDEVLIQAVNGGDEGNVSAGQITQFPVTIQGISEITNDEPTTGGYNRETDGDYRNRYYEKLRSPVNGVNANQYRIWAESIDGVGKARVVPIWQGKNSVKVLLVGNNFEPASDNLVESVQDYIDPNKNGDGNGVAPIGAVTTVVPADTLAVEVTIYGLVIEKTNLEDDTKREIETAIRNYVRTTAFNTDYVSLARIGASVLSVPNVKDYREIRLNGAHDSITVGNEECAKLVGVNYEE